MRARDNFQLLIRLAVVAPLLNRVSVHRNILLDGRLALFHKRQHWLAVADLHFGYELSQRARGHLFPLWGMENIENRVEQLLIDYQPRQLILLGDLVHDRAGVENFSGFVSRVKKKCEVILITGNHDRRATSHLSRLKLPCVESWRANGFFFHHGDCPMDIADCVQIVGHHHPTGAIRDGAGLRLKLPAFVQENARWIMPAFSPWAAGANWFDADGGSQIWLCSPQRVFKLNGA